MSYIQIIPPSRATGETADAYQHMSRLGPSKKISKIVQIFSLQPESMKRMIRIWELAMWMGDEPRQTCEMVGAVVSRLNGCHY